MFCCGELQPPVGADNCSGQTTTQTSGLPTGSSFPVGATTNAFRVTDAAGNSVTCAFTVTVSDTQAPLIVCPSNQIKPANGTCSGTVGTWAPVSLSDNCTPAGTITVSQTPPPTTSLLGHNASVLVTLTATDGSGNMASCFFTVTLKDQTPPVAKCKSGSVNLGINGTLTLLPASVNNGSTDNCSFSLMVTPNMFTCSNIGFNTVTLKATDAGGNTATCTAIVMVKDISGPNALCKNPTIFLNDAGQATLTTAQVNNGSTDNCGIGTMSIDKTSFNCSEISGRQPVILSMTDVNGNTSSCLSYVTVKDAIAPTALCEDVIVELGSNGTATVYGADLAGNSTDNCSVWSYSPVAKVYTSAHLGNNNLTITVKDFSGNASTCVSVVTVGPFLNPSPLAPDHLGSEESLSAGVSDFAFHVFPNPTSGDVAVAFELLADQPVIIRVFDLQGRMILSHQDLGLEGENTYWLGLKGLTPGMYIVDFQSEGLKGQKRLVVQE
ncbi:MAG: HYR domain-containing protein [Lewinellaceae bacterium]|nr:HYR domain-containing protein [Lewinellaceae bacterium]